MPQSSSLLISVAISSPFYSPYGSFPQRFLARLPLRGSSGELHTEARNFPFKGERCEASNFRRIRVLQVRFLLPLAAATRSDAENHIIAFARRANRRLEH